MYCTRCGTQLNETAKFCSECGHATAQAASSSFQQSYAHMPFSRPREGRKIAGVCAGFARYMNVDVTLVRLIAIVLLLFPPSCGLLAYIIAWIVMPNDPWTVPQAHQAAPVNGHA